MYHFIDFEHDNYMAIYNYINEISVIKINK